MITLPPALDHRQCSNCRHWFPLESFRKRYKDPANPARMYECKRCHADKEKRRFTENREKLKQREFRKSLTQLGHAEPSHLNEFCAGLLEKFGGVELVMDRLADTYERAKPGSPARVRALLATLNVIMAGAAAETKRRERSEEDISRMSDDELKWSLNERLREIVESDPSLAIQSAAEAGWQVIPPDEDRDL